MNIRTLYIYLSQLLEIVRTKTQMFLKFLFFLSTSKNSGAWERCLYKITSVYSINRNQLKIQIKKST
jgi:hypothetical protein